MPKNKLIKDFLSDGRSIIVKNPNLKGKLYRVIRTSTRLFTPILHKLKSQTVSLQETYSPQIGEIGLCLGEMYLAKYGTSAYKSYKLLMKNGRVGFFYRGNLELAKRQTKTKKERKE